MNTTAADLAKAYEPGDIERKWTKRWLEAGLFHAHAASEKPPFSMVIPPPNVTSQLHIGHALDNTMQDIIARYKRMRGFETLWMPGTDHAGIATQVKVESRLHEEGVTRDELGRAGFLDRVWAWKGEYRDRIVSQLKALGSSCDWARERFTMDEGCSEAVREAFVEL
ncbi:MAG TPA: class I tRNA ligase family protein, partial [Limnochordia bacterium]|nr:class I tRNA ligase family protein [Limnochordia bacterium]